MKTIEIIDKESYEEIRKAVVSFLYQNTSGGKSIDIHTLAEDCIQQTICNYLRYGEKVSKDSIDKNTGLISLSYLYTSVINQVRDTFRSGDYKNIVRSSKEEFDTTTIINKFSNSKQHDESRNEIQKEYRGDLRFELILEATEKLTKNEKTAVMMLIDGFSESEIRKETGTKSFTQINKKLRKKIGEIISSEGLSMSL